MRLSHSLAVGVIVLAISSPSIAQTASQPQAPFKAGNRYFFVSSTGAFCVRNSLQGDARQLIQAGAFETLAPSRDGQYIAYSMPAYNRPSSDVLILNVSSGGVYPEVLHHARISRAPWTANSQGFLYTREDTTEHRERVYYHRVGEPQTKDEIVYSRQDALDWRYDARVSDDGRFAILTISHPQDAQTRLYFIDLGNPGKPALTAPVVQLVDVFGARDEFVGNSENSLYLQTDDSAPQGQIVLANTDMPSSARWPVVWPESADTLRFAEMAGKTYVVAVYQNGGQSIARVLTLPVSNQTSRPTSFGMRGFGMGMGGGGGMSRRGMGGRGGGGGGGMGNPGGGRSGREGTLGRRLEFKGEIPLPAGSAIVDMRSVADDDELLYTVKQTDGTLGSYVYNVKNGENRVFETHVATH